MHKKCPSEDIYISYTEVKKNKKPDRPSEL